MAANSSRGAAGGRMLVGVATGANKIEIVHSSPQQTIMGPVKDAITQQTQSKFNKLWLIPDRKQKTRIQMALDVQFGRNQSAQPVDRDIGWQIVESPPRREDMSAKQDWTSVWPAAQTFKQSAVPFPVRMGYQKHAAMKPPHDAYANLQLMKIPNFLHLTPQHVYRQCQAIKKFCTRFPPELKKQSMRTKYTPVTLTYSDVVHQGTNIRDERARAVTARVQLAGMGLRDTHAYNKCTQLAGDRFDIETGTIKFEADRCPLRRQNIEFINFVLTALHHESNKVEPWEGAMVQELLGLQERDRLEREGKPESPTQEAMMMKASNR